MLLVEADALDSVRALKDQLRVVFLKFYVGWVYHGLALADVSLPSQFFDFEVRQSRDLLRHCHGLAFFLSLSLQKLVPDSLQNLLYVLTAFDQVVSDPQFEIHEGRLLCLLKLNLKPQFFLLCVGSLG